MVGRALNTTMLPYLSLAIWVPIAAGVLVLAASLGGCSELGGWFDWLGTSKSKTPLPGKRIAVLQTTRDFEVDPKLADGRLVLRIVILNRGAAAASFAPADVHVTTPDGAAIALVPRETLLAEQGGGGQGRSESSQLHAAPAMPVNGAGQTDVSGYTGGMAATTAGVPQATLDQNRAPSPAVAARLSTRST